MSKQTAPSALCQRGGRDGKTRNVRFFLPHYGFNRWVELDPRYSNCALKMVGRFADENPVEKTLFAPVFYLRNLMESGDCDNEIFSLTWSGSDTVRIRFKAEQTVFLFSREEIKLVLEMAGSLERIRGDVEQIYREMMPEESGEADSDDSNVDKAIALAERVNATVEAGLDH